MLGHSAGGNYAVEYAIRHPSAVGAVISDCPFWDFDARPPADGGGQDL
ncbi:alpha/beta fold hydrolase [Kribbella sp. VKM Ac-2571]